MSIPFIDHIVLPVESLHVARQRWASLGFNVAGLGIHPFGTANTCIFLGDGTYLEPLGIHDAVLAETCAREGNCFVARDAEFRRSGPPEGFSAFVLRSSDADADHARFENEQISGGKPLSFSRNVMSTDGSASVASFRLAFADLGSARFFAFTCQRVNAALPTSGQSVEHPNGVKGLAIVRLGTDGSKCLDRLRILLELQGRETASGKAFSLGNCDIFVDSVESEEAFQPMAKKADFTGIGIGFRVEDLSQTRLHLQASAITYRELEYGIAVDAEEGQGCIVEFVE